MKRVRDFVLGSVVMAVVVSSGVGWGQSRATVELSRYNWPAPVIVQRWIDYMGLESLTQEERKAGEAAVKALAGHFTAARPDLMLVELETYLAGDAPDELGAMALYYYFNRLVDLEGAIPAPEDFDKALPSWELLRGPNTKFFFTYVHLDLAWQARAEGNETLEREYFERVRSGTDRLMDELPDDPVQVWNVYNFILASRALGEESVADAIVDLKQRVATRNPSVLTWTARFQLATVPNAYATVPNETEEHFAVMASQLEADFMLAAYADPTVMPDVKAMLLLDSGNVWLVRNENEAARSAFDAVLSDFGSRMEWTPRRQGRTIVNPSEYGVVSMTAHSRVYMELTESGGDSGKAIAAMDRFIERYPNSEHADDWLWRKAEHCEFTGDLDRARAAYEVLETERTYSPHSAKASERRAAVDAKLAARAVE